MGGTTPNFGIRFPHQVEPVTLTHFKNMADDMDAALQTLTALRADAVGMPALKKGGPSTPTAVVPNTTVTLAIGGTGDWTAYDTHGMFTPGVNDRLTCKKAGIYQVTARMSGANNPGVTGINAFEFKLLFSGVYAKLFQHKNNLEGKTSPGGWQINAIWPMAVNDFVQVQAWWSGTGTNLAPFVTVEARCVALL